MIVDWVGIVIGALGQTEFAILTWGSVFLVLVGFLYVIRALFGERQQGQ